MAGGKKRKGGHLGLQAQQVASIEDEMAAIAAEYGLTVEDDVQANVRSRKEAKRKPKRRTVATSTTKEAHAKPSVQLQPLQKTNEMIRLSDVLPSDAILGSCQVPDCNCASASLTIDKEDEIQDEVREGKCRKCKHGYLQHSIIRVDDDKKPIESQASNAPTGVRLLSLVFQWIKTARISFCILHSRTWSNSSLDHLRSLLLSCKSQMVQAHTGGTNDGASSPQEREMVLSCLNELQKADIASSTFNREEVAIEIACILDNMYFQCYYASIVLHGRLSTIVHRPDKYLMELERLWGEDPQASLQQFINQELVGDNIPSSIVDSLHLPKDKRQEPIALLDIFHCRLREGVRLFYDQGIGLHGEMDKVSKQPPQTKKRKSKPSRRDAKDELAPMPAFSLLSKWRDNCRDWCCHLYAYATPTSEALDVLQAHAPLVEMGAGTGYWSSLLQSKNVDIIAYDQTPPAVDSANAYHGSVPPFCAVHAGGPEVLEGMDRNLFLCYPPPNNPMALDCLQAFKGDTLLLVGEWEGDTGDRKFEAALLDEWHLVQQVDLPNWGNSAYSLTVWQRDAEGQHLRELTCNTCKLKQEEEGEVRRCRLCKTNVYCSSSCMTKDTLAHEAEHAKRLVFVEEIDFESHFEDMVGEPLD